MDAGDAAAWVGAITGVGALIVSSVAGAFSWRSLMFEKEATESARRSAEAAERANVLTERALTTGVPTTPANDSDVKWAIENPGGKNRFVLRNLGTERAEHVAVDDLDGLITRNFPTDAVVRPNEGIDLLIMGSWGNPVPNQLYVRWGDGNEAVVPMPV